jgi:hypothetical protein
MDEAVSRPKSRRKAAPEPSIDLVFSQDFAHERLSERELDALCPILSELVSELLMMRQTLDDTQE